MTDEELFAALKSLPAEKRKSALDAIAERCGAGYIQAYAATQGKEQKPRRPFRDGIISADNLPTGIEPTRLWFGLYPGSVVFLIGETGAGKSSLLYNMAVHIARNDPLWGISFGAHRPLNVLYADPENAGNWIEGNGGVCSQKIDRIDAGRPPTLKFHDWRDCDLTDAWTQEELRQYMAEMKTDVLLLDPIANIFGTKDENDNAEAAKQMKILTALSRETGVCIILCHHVGKADISNYGRGATARLAAADVGMVFRVRADMEDVDDDYTGEMIARDDVCRLQIVKNRWEGRASIYLKMTGEDRFERVGQKEWKEAAAGNPKTKEAGQEAVQKLYQAKESIAAFLVNGETRTAEQIIAFCRADGIGETNTRDALKELREDKKVVQEREGRQTFYRLTMIDNNNSPLKENGYYHQSLEGAEQVDKQFFNPPARQPYKDDDSEWRTA